MGEWTLLEILTSHVEYSSSWAVYADGLEPDSKARVGQTAFENGGVLDKKRFVINGIDLGDAKLAWIGDAGEYEEEDYREAWQNLINNGEFLEFLKDNGYIEGEEEE